MHIMNNRISFPMPKCTSKIIFGVDAELFMNGDLFLKIIDLIRAEGNIIHLFVNDLQTHKELFDGFEKHVDAVIYYGNRAKMDVSDVDVWLDDCPLSITHFFNKKTSGYFPCETIRRDLDHNLLINIDKKEEK